MGGDGKRGKGAENDMGKEMGKQEIEGKGGGLTGERKEGEGKREGHEKKTKMCVLV